MALKIAKFFDKNPKANPIQKNLPVLFKFFSNLMMAYYSPEKTERGIAAWLGVNEWQVRKSILPAMKNYNGVKVMKILSKIREIDARSKGVGNTNTSNGELMDELMNFILY
jgi:DNA polymerase-3 subunit delta